MLDFQGDYRNLTYRGDPVELTGITDYMRGKQEPRTFTIHHTKSERVEIVELTEAMEYWLQQVGSFTHYTVPPLEVSWIANKQDYIVSHLLRITREDILTERIIESPT